MNVTNVVALELEFDTSDARFVNIRFISDAKIKIVINLKQVQSCRALRTKSYKKLCKIRLR